MKSVVDHVELFICDEYTPQHYAQQVWSPTEPLQTLKVSFLAEQHLLSINTEIVTDHVVGVGEDQTFAKLFSSVCRLQLQTRVHTALTTVSARLAYMWATLISVDTQHYATAYRCSSSHLPIPGTWGVKTHR